VRQAKPTEANSVLHLPYERASLLGYYLSLGPKSVIWSKYFVHKVEDLTLCITAFNEEENIESLIGDLLLLKARFRGLSVKIRDNCSSDSTYILGCKLLEAQEAIDIYRGEENLGYGGGMRATVLLSETKYVMIFPADGQYPMSAAIAAIDDWCLTESEVLVGQRTKRSDSRTARIQSAVYSWMCRLLLRLDVWDINGLPKIFPREFVELESFPYSKTFFFDAQLLVIARERHLSTSFCEVKFRRRMNGTSSWATRRLRTFWKVSNELIAFRRFLNASTPG